MSVQTNKQNQKVGWLKEELESQVEEAQRIHQDKIEEIVQKSEEKVMNLSEETEGKKKLQKEKIEMSLNNLSKKLLALQKDFKEESDCRKVGVERMSQTFYDELQQLKEVVDRQQERRVSSERKIQAMVE